MSFSPVPGDQTSATAPEGASTDFDGPDPQRGLAWWLAGLQVVLVCGIPTQLFVFGLLLAFRTPMGIDGASITAEPSHISLQFFAMIALLDTALIAMLIRIFLLLGGERSDDVFLNGRPIGREIVRGLLLVPALWVLVVAVVSLLGAAFPSLHNVPTNPYAAYMDTPLDAGVFIVVVVLAGGVREELQRAFILHRFRDLGGPYVGLGVFSLVFGLLHLPQGIDVSLAVGLLGVIWGLMYIRRRSVVAPMVSHAGFDVVQVLQQVLVHAIPR